MRDQSLETLAVRAGTRRSEFHEHSEALFLTSSFTFASAAEAAAMFQNAGDGFVYSRFSNPTVAMFQDRLAALEGAGACLATSSGMSAIFALCLGTLKAGDHLVSSKSIFGATVQLFSTLLTRYGIEVTYVDLKDPAQWKAALRPTTRFFYLESPSNPLGEVADLKALKAITEDAGVLLVVDNCFCSPALQRPIDFGADVVIHSATKFLDGQGRVLGGAILGSRKFIDEQIAPVLRTSGPSLSPFNAWVLLKGLETLQIRMERQSQTALALAQWLEKQQSVERVYFPGLVSHPQHALVVAQQKAGGAVVSFDVKGASDDDRRARAWRIIDHCKLFSITANLGDTRSTITHPATTTHGRLTPEARAAAGINEGLLRLAIGLESLDDLIQDIVETLSA